MKQFFVLALASIATAARLDNTYLPPHAATSSGSHVGLQTPIGAAETFQNIKGAGQIRSFQTGNHIEELNKGLHDNSGNVPALNTISHSANNFYAVKSQSTKSFHGGNQQSATSPYEKKNHRSSSEHQFGRQNTQVQSHQNFLSSNALSEPRRTGFGSINDHGTNGVSDFGNSAFTGTNVPEPNHTFQNLGSAQQLSFHGTNGQNLEQNYHGANHAQILRFENQGDEHGYQYAYETSDGTKAEQRGRVVPGAVPEEGSLQVMGSYSYVGDDGQTYTVTYTADENGYQPQGDHLPTPPPIPAAILRSLQLTAGPTGQYDSQKSSYDADAGY